MAFCKHVDLSVHALVQLWESQEVSRRDREIGLGGDLCSGFWSSRPLWFQCSFSEQIVWHIRKTDTIQKNRYHVAYIPLVSPTCLLFKPLLLNYQLQLPDCAQDAIPATCSPSQKKTIMTHCCSNLMQHVWKVILDNDFKEAYAHGFVAECLDGRCRWFYPWILTYSADYPESMCIMNLIHPKVLTISLTGSSWPEFEIKCSVHALDASSQSLIFTCGFGITSAAVERILKPESWTGENLPSFYDYAKD